MKIIKRLLAPVIILGLMLTASPAMACSKNNNYKLGHRAGARIEQDTNIYKKDNRLLNHFSREAHTKAFKKGFYKKSISYYRNSVVESKKDAISDTKRAIPMLEHYRHQSKAYKYGWMDADAVYTPIKHLRHNHSYYEGFAHGIHYYSGHGPAIAAYKSFFQNGRLKDMM